MAKLSRMSICGIRSFGPNEEDMQDLKFSSPVTLLLGENGCGKTTVIECLKFVCSGELPGGTKSGQGFVNDPKLNSSSTTKGRVKLQLIDGKGNNVIIYKSVKVEQTSLTNQRFSTLDSTIKVTKPNGEELCLSSRCADIGSQACTVMGVSKAILNNVIFCHQENSLWPLDEGKKLKEKFDEIFDVTKYNECIDSTRKKIKNELASLKSLDETLFYKKEKKDAVERDKAKLQDKEEKLQKFIEDIAKNQQDMKPVYDRIQEICELETNFSDLQKVHAGKETERNSLLEQQKNILKKLVKEFVGSDEDLQTAIMSFEDNYKKTESLITKTERLREEIEKQEQSRTTLIQKSQVRLGQLQEEKKQLNKMIDERNALIEGTTSKLESSQTYNLDNNEEIKKVIEALHTMLNKSKATLDSLYYDLQEKEKDLQRNIDICRENVTKINQKIKLKEELCSELNKKNRDVNSQLRRLNVSDEELKSYDTKIANIERDLTTLLQNFDTNSVASKIETNKKELRKLEENQEHLEKEYKILQKNYVVENDIETRTHDINKKVNEIDELKNNHFEEFQQIFNEIPEKDVKLAIQKCQQNFENKIGDLRRKIEMKRKEATTFENNIHFEKEKLLNLKDELEASEKKIFAVCEGQSYDKIYSDTEQNIEKLQKSRGQLSSAKIMYGKFLKDFQNDKPCCPVCETEFTNKINVVNKIITRIENQIQDIPLELKKVEEELRKKQNLFNSIQQLKPVHSKIEELKFNLVPNTESSVIDITNKFKIAERDLENLNDELISPQIELDICNKIISDAALIDKNQTEVELLNKNILELKTQLVKSNSIMSREQVESEINMLKINIQEIRLMCETDQKKLDQNKTKCQELREQKNRIIEKRINLQKTMQGKPQLQEQVKELVQKIDLLESEAKEMKEQLKPLQEKLNLAEIELNETKRKNKTKLDKEHLQYNELEKKCDGIKNIQIAIDDYLKKDIQRQFNVVLEQFNTYKSELDTFKLKKDELSNEILKLKQQQASRDFDRQKLDENLDLRNKRKEVTVLTIKIDELAKQLGTYNFNSLQSEKNRLQSKYIKLQGDIHTKEGQKGELKLSIDELTNELQMPENRQAYKLYKHKFYERKVCEKAVNDLKLFIEGLESAIIEFHKEKMTKINKAIRELWRSIYRGNDIDYIQIKTEEASSTASKRVYNYKVVQIKNDVELEMRGRCSAGQKVLACLIIRIALADTFSHNCGILALDEPTTNLDRENIISLSEALARMVNTRRVEKNFQLIVITHDEDFVRALSTAERIEYCLRVKRNNRGNSVITRESI